MVRDKMTNLKPHEQKVLDILVSGTIPDDVLRDIKVNPRIVAYDVTGNGYFLTIEHPSLPMDRIVCDKPMLIGECDGVETGFVVFIQNGGLTIECHGWGDKDVPKNYRDSRIRIKA